jgi:hypothetical protein
MKGSTVLEGDGSNMHDDILFYQMQAYATTLISCLVVLFLEESFEDALPVLTIHPNTSISHLQYGYFCSIVNDDYTGFFCKKGVRLSEPRCTKGLQPF